MVEIPGYKVIRQLGRGGMATVYLAEQALVEREVALKVMAPQLTVDPSFGERFLREARIAAKLRHPNIVSIIEVGVHGDYHYAAMEYLSGGPIVARDGDTVGLLEALRAVREIAVALDYAHSKGVVHRDVKPDNILLRDDGSAVLGDFGIARAVDASGAVTRTGTVVGTPLYMSPEQLRGKHVDGRSDLYSLGVVCFQLLSGRAPYVAEDALALGIMHMTSPIPALPAVFERAQPLVSKLLAKEPADRFQSGAAVVAAITELEAEINSAGAAPTRLLQPAPPDPIETPSDLDGHRGGRSEPTIGEMNEAVAERWRVTPRPQGKRPRLGWGLPLLLLVVLVGALGWWQQALWLPQARAWVEAQIGAEDARLEEVSNRRAQGRLYTANGDDALALLTEILQDKPDDSQALGALAAAWPELLTKLREFEASDASGAQVLRSRLIALRPDDPALRTSEPDPQSSQIAQTATQPASTQPDPLSTAASAEDAERADAAAALSDAEVEALMSEQLSSARAAERERRWYGEDGALAAYQSALRLRPESGPARAGLLRLIDRIQIDAREALQRRQLVQPARDAVEALAGIEAADGAHAELVRLLDLADRRGAGADRTQRINAAINSADELIRRGKPSDQALLDLADQLAEAANLDRRDPRLREAIDKVAALLLVRAGERVDGGQTSVAESLLNRARVLTPDSTLLEDLQIRIRQPDSQASQTSE